MGKCDSSKDTRDKCIDCNEFEITVDPFDDCVKKMPDYNDGCK